MSSSHHYEPREPRKQDAADVPLTIGERVGCSLAAIVGIGLAAYGVWSLFFEKP